MTIMIDPAQNLDPWLAVALDMIDFNRHDKNIRINATVPFLDRSRFEVQVGTWGNRIMRNAGVSWMWASGHTSDIQTGVIQWRSDSGGQAIRVNFHRSFVTRDPDIFLGIRGVDVGDNWRIDVRSTDISPTGFEAQIRTWGSSKLWACDIQWIASVSSSTRVGRFWGQGRNRGTVSFTRPIFNVTPKLAPQIMVGITRFDLRSDRNARLRLVTSNVTTRGFDWEIQTWSDSEIYALEACYIVPTRIL